MSTCQSLVNAKPAMPLIRAAMTLGVLLIVSGCGQRDAATPPVDTPTTASTAPSTAQAPATDPADAKSPSATTAISLKCEESALTDAGQFIAENNVWGKQGVADWMQCMGAAALAHVSGQPAAMRAHWKWDWKHQGDNVKAFPEIVFGHKPGFPKSSTTLLPRKLSSLQTLNLSYDVTTEREGAGNLSIDMWLTSNNNPTTFAVPPITHEVMIWLEAYGPMYQGGELVDHARINGTLYRVHVGEKFGLGWRYVAFAPNSPMQTTATVNLLPFFEYLRGKGYLTTDEHLSAVNLGNEIISGNGETKVNRLAVQVN